MARWTNSRGASPLLAILAVLLVAGFLYWLNLEAQEVDQEVEPVPEEGETSGEPVDFVPAQVVESPGNLVGQEGVLRDVGVSQALGRGVVTIDLDGENRLAVLLAPDLIAQGAAPNSGEQVTVYGRMYALSDSIRGAWVDGGAVDQGNAGAIPETATFVLADSLSFN